MSLWIFGSESPDKIIIRYLHIHCTFSQLRNFLPQIMQLVKYKRIFLKICSFHCIMLCFDENRLLISSSCSNIYIGYHFKFLLLCILGSRQSVCSFLSASVMWLIMASKKVGHCFPEYVVCEHLSCEMLLKKSSVDKYIWVMICLMPFLRES